MKGELVRSSPSHPFTNLKNYVTRRVRYFHRPPWSRSHHHHGGLWRRGNQQAQGEENLLRRPRLEHTTDASLLTRGIV